MTMPALNARWRRPFKKLDSVSVALVDVSPDVEKEAAALGWLDEEERSRWRGYAYDGPRRRFLLCRAALRALLCERLACENERLAFKTSRRGKPFALVEDSPASISFNVSHSGNHGLIGLAPTGRLGVDIEERDAQRNLDLLIDTVLGEVEKAELDTKHGTERTYLFFKLWTFKEALLKACGEGFSLDATCIEIPLAVLRGMKRCTLRLPQFPGVAWRVADIGNADFAAAVAYEATNPLSRKE